MCLLDYLKKNYPLNPEKLKDFSRQLLKTVIYLHEKNIVHRDIKPQNILVKFNRNSGQETLKLIDYGFSTLSNFLFNTQPISPENSMSFVVLPISWHPNYSVLKSTLEKKPTYGRMGS